MYKIFCKDFITGKRHVMTFEVKASVFDYASLFVSFIKHGQFKVTCCGELILSRVW